MLTKEKCLNAVNELILNWGYEGLEEDLEPIYQMIREHFDNPPLKFEEIKEGMFVFDNKHHTYILIDRIWETYNKTIYFYAIGWECCENTEFEENRFYRKEVQE